MYNEHSQKKFSQDQPRGIHLHATSEGRDYKLVQGMQHAPAKCIRLKIMPQTNSLLHI